MTLSPRTIARSILRWDWLSCVSSAARRTRFMWGSNPSRIPRYPRPPFSSTITFELIRWLRRESGLIIGPRRSHGGGVLKGLREAGHGERCSTIVTDFGEAASPRSHVRCLSTDPRENRSPAGYPCPRSCDIACLCDRQSPRRPRTLAPRSRLERPRHLVLPARALRPREPGLDRRRGRGPPAPRGLCRGWSVPRRYRSAPAHGCRPWFRGG